jgi:hypothetical protein
MSDSNDPKSIFKYLVNTEVNQIPVFTNNLVLIPKQTTVTADSIATENELKGITKTRCKCLQCVSRNI